MSAYPKNTQSAILRKSSTGAMLESHFSALSAHALMSNKVQVEATMEATKMALEAHMDAIVALANEMIENLRKGS